MRNGWVSAVYYFAWVFLSHLSPPISRYTWSPVESAEATPSPTSEQASPACVGWNLRPVFQCRDPIKKELYYLSSARDRPCTLPWGNLHPSPQLLLCKACSFSQAYNGMARELAVQEVPGSTPPHSCCFLGMLTSNFLGTSVTGILLQYICLQ